MTMKKTIASLIAAFLLCGIVLPETSVYADAAQEENKADIRIESREDFRRFAESCSLDSWSIGKTVSLETDLNFGGEDIAPVPSFSGTFLGNGHQISGMTLSTDGSNQALFRYVTADAVIRNLKVSGSVSPSNGCNYVGGIAGTSWGSLENCSFHGSISGKNYVGGIVGDNHGTVSNCSFSGNVDGKRFSGGIAGYSEGLIRDCRNTGDVNITVSEGRVELADLATASNSLALSLLSAEDENVVSDSGGVVGFSKGVVLNCTNSGTVGYPHYGYNVGGIAGRQSGYLSGCTNTGSVFGKKDVAGITGQMEPHLNLVESSNLADELLLLNKYMNNASADIAVLAEDIRDMQADIEAERKDDGPVHSGGEIYHADEEIPTDSGEESGTGTITPANDGSSSDSGTSGTVLDNDQVQGVIESATGTIEKQTDGAITGDDIDALARKSEEAIQARFNELSARLADAYGVFSESGGALAYDLNMANNQFSRVMLMMANAINGAAQNDLFQDVSEELGETVTEGNVAGNINHASIEGDNNVGGIAGSMGIEYEFDLEDSLVQLVGANGIISNTYNSTCVNSGNVNYGQVSGKKDRIGGIVGSEETGTVIRCESYGSTESTEGSYVGGIAGYSDTSIRSSSVLATVQGTRYVGGIAGSGKDLYDNISIIDTDTHGAFIGAVAGWADMTSGGSVTGNRFVHDTLGGVDGISYAGRAEPVSYEELVSQESAPAALRKVKLSFFADGEPVRELTVDYGSDLEEERIPPVPAKPGYTGTWGEFETDNIRFSRDIEAVYTLNRSTLASEQTGKDSPQSVVLLEGSFEETATLEFHPYTGTGPETAADTVVENWEILVQNTDAADGSYTVRYLAPENVREGETAIWLLKDGEWTPVETETSGSYLVFPAEGNPIIFSAVSPEAKQPFPVIPVAVGCGVILLLTILLMKSRKRGKTKTQKEDAQQT